MGQTGRTRLPGAILALLAGLTTQVPAWGRGTDRLMIGLGPAARAASTVQSGPGLKQRLAAAGIPVASVNRNHAAGVAVVHLSAPVSAGRARALARGMAKVAGVAFAEPDRPVRAAYVPNDPLYATRQWYLHEDTAGIRAPGAWDLQRGAPGVVVAVLDTGTVPHSDMDSARLLPGYDFISDPAIANDGDGRDPDPSDPGDWTAGADSSWHGLRIMGLIMATADNGIGIAGVNHGSRILPVRVLGQGGGRLSDILDAMAWSAGLTVPGVPDNPHPARVLNLSATADGSCGAAEQSVIDAVVAAGTTVVVAAGNHGTGASADVANITPANCDKVVTVAAVTRSGALAPYSNTGAAVDISAPGGDAADSIASTTNTGTTSPVPSPGGDGYAGFDGTSPATALVSAVASLMISENPALTPVQVEALLKTTARPFVDASCTSALCGAGLLDARAAVAAAPDPPAVSSAAGGGGGGGCALGASGPMDGPLLAVVVWGLLAAARRVYRR